MDPRIAVMIGAVLTLIVVVLLYITVLPKKRNGKFKSKFLQGLHNYFHFKKLFIEEILRFVFVLLTVGCICCGFFLLFARYTMDFGGGYSATQHYWMYGLAAIIGGPIALRLVYEILMMGILLVQNVIDMNKKLDGTAKKEAPAPVRPAAPVSAPAKPQQAPSYAPPRSQAATYAPVQAYAPPKPQAPTYAPPKPQPSETATAPAPKPTEPQPKEPPVTYGEEY